AGVVVPLDHIEGQRERALHVLAPEAGAVGFLGIEFLGVPATAATAGHLPRHHLVLAAFRRAGDVAVLALHGLGPLDRALHVSTTIGAAGSDLSAACLAARSLLHSS